MAFLKYKGEDGNFVAINYYKVNNIIVSQTKGQLRLSQESHVL